MPASGTPRDILVLIQSDYYFSPGVPLFQVPDCRWLQGSIRLHSPLTYVRQRTEFTARFTYIPLGGSLGIE
jgi:hypothetical protein